MNLQFAVILIYKKTGIKPEGFFVITTINVALINNSVKAYFKRKTIIEKGK